MLVTVVATKAGAVVVLMTTPVTEEHLFKHFRQIFLTNSRAD